MLNLLLTAALLASAADPSVRVPGTRLKLGMTERQAQTAGEFAASGAAAAGATERKGELRFFGVLCQTTLTFTQGRLTRASFEADGVSPKALAYVEDQLRRHRMWKECSRYEPDHHACVWHGELKVHLETRPGRLEARAEPIGAAPWETEPAADSAAAQTAAAQPPPNPAAEAPATPPPAPVGKPEAPKPEPAPAGNATTAAAALGGRPAPAAPGTLAGADPSPTAIAALPETLTISLVTKNSPADWPRIVSSPPLEYPDAARRESVQGIVWVLALVNADGSVQSAQVHRGIRELDAAAVAWIRQSRFAPCERNGAPCRFWVRVAVRFTLY